MGKHVDWGRVQELADKIREQGLSLTAERQVPDEFFVRQLEVRWLFNDFSGGLGGSIIDLVGHLESLRGIARAPA